MGVHVGALLLALVTAMLLVPDLAFAKHARVTRHYKFDIRLQNITRLCHTKTVVTVNGQVPGPKIVAREGDRVLVKVVNHVQNNLTLHWGFVGSPIFLVCSLGLKDMFGKIQCNSYSIQRNAPEQAEVFVNFREENEDRWVVQMSSETAWVREIFHST